MAGHGTSEGQGERRNFPRTLAVKPNLESIEEKEGDVEFIERYFYPPRRPRKARWPSSLSDEKYVRSTETPSSIFTAERELLRDKFGFPLIPQPLDDPKDPLTWSKSVKIRILIQVSLHSFLSHFSAFAISPAIWPLHQYLNASLIETSYLVGAYLILLGVAPLIWNPLSHSFGRRPLLIVGLAGSAASSIGCGLARHYAMMVVFRTLNGLFAGAAIGLGTVICCDIFYEYQRGFFIGIYMLVHMTGGHLAPILGGFIYRGLNWHWCFFVPAIAAAVLLVGFVVSVPETLYSRAVESLVRPHMSEYQKERIRRRRSDSRKIRFSNFTRQFKMLRYPSVAIPALFYAVASGYGNIIFIISSAILFRMAYHLKTYQIGLLLGIPLTLGSLIGEAGAGGFSDWVIRRRAMVRGGKRVAEDRLFAMIPGVVLLPLGLIIEAHGIMHKAPYWIPGLGIGLSSAGLQIITTVTYAYTADCYSRQSAEIGSLLNFGRQIFAFFVGFYAIPFAHRWGLQVAWMVFAGIEIVCFIPIVCLMFRGMRWREAVLPPDWNLDL